MLKRWLRRWTKVRHREAAERTLLTAIASGFPPALLADALLAAETERAFADTGHSLDFINKAFECLDLIGWEHAPALLPTVVGQMVAARGADESTAWRQPVDLVALCDEAISQLPDLFTAGSGAAGWSSCNAMGAFVISPLASLGQTEFLIGPGPSLRARFAARPSTVPYDPIRLPDAYPSISRSQL